MKSLHHATILKMAAEMHASYHGVAVVGGFQACNQILQRVYFNVYIKEYNGLL